MIIRWGKPRAAVAPIVLTSSDTPRPCSCLSEAGDEVVTCLPPIPVGGVQLPSDEDVSATQEASQHVNEGTRRLMQSTNKGLSERRLRRNHSLRANPGSSAYLVDDRGTRGMIGGGEEE